MKSPLLRRVALFAVAVILVGLIAYRASEPNEPRYQGRRIRAWLSDYYVPPKGGLEQWNRRWEAEKAIQEIGPKAAPYIIRWLKVDGSAWKRQYRTLFPKLPSWVKKMLQAPGEPLDERLGSQAFLDIGQSVKPALVKALKDDNPVVRSAAAQALWFIGHYKGADLRDAVPALIEALRDTDASVRFGSASALGYIGPDAKAAVADLIPLLRDPETGRQKSSQVYVRSAAARTLGKIGPEARSALPSLRMLISDNDAYRRCVAAIAIWRIDSDVTNTLPVLLQALSQVTEDSKWEPLEALGEMGGRAKEAFPILLGQLNLQQTDAAHTGFTLSKITNALVKIDPEVAAKAGVK